MNLTRCILAIDPGASGGIAFRAVTGIITAEAMPKTEGDVLDCLKLYAHMVPCGQTLTAYVEEVGGFCGKGQPGSSMFKFGRGFGFILGVLMANGWRVVLVRPQRWMKPLGIGTKSACVSASQWKNKLKALAQRLFPSCKPTLSTADALLILDYAINLEDK